MWKEIIKLNHLQDTSSVMKFSRTEPGRLEFSALHLNAFPCWVTEGARWRVEMVVFPSTDTCNTTQSGPAGYLQGFGDVRNFLFSSTVSLEGELGKNNILNINCGEKFNFYDNIFVMDEMFQDHNFVYTLQNVNSNLFSEDLIRIL